MADTLFSAGTVVASSWLNEVNTDTHALLTSVAGGNTITATGPVSMTGYATGQRFFFNPAANNTTNVTININGLGARAITKLGNILLIAQDLLVGTMAEIVYDGAGFQLLNPQTFNLTNTVPAANLTGTVAIANGGTAATTASQALINLGATGRLIGIQTFLASSTYTPTAGMTSVIVEAVGAGGAGGGATGTAAAQFSLGVGGGGGAHTIGRFISPGSQPVTIGTGGTGVVGGTGNSGTSTSFGGLLTAPGGSGGASQPTAAVIVAQGTSGGAVGIGGNILATAGKMSPPVATGVGYGAPGADGIFASGGNLTGGSGNGLNAAVTAYGAGGGGGVNQASQGIGRAGGNGAPGYLIVYEYS